MVEIYYLQVNLIGMVILGVILLNQQNIDDGTGRQKAFIYLNYSVFAILAFDSAMWYIDGKQFPFSIEINWAISSIYYLLSCIIVFIWFIYFSLFLHQNKIKNHKYFLISCIPVILNALFVFLNIKYNIFFSIDENNIYSRSPIFLISLFIVLPYLAIPFFNCIKFYKTSDNLIEKKDCMLIMKIHILPIIGTIFQSLFYGVSLIWICTVLSLLFIFINFQNKRISTDPLTQLNNRCQFDICLQSIRRDVTRDETYSIVIIDVDKFKEINDTYGHIFGDKVLISVAGILRKACQNEGAIIGRYGGDEFYIFCKMEVRDNIIKHINRYVEEYNEVDDVGIGLSLSIGSSDFEAEDIRKVENIVEKADKAMYANKVK